MTRRYLVRFLAHLLPVLPAVLFLTGGVAHAASHRDAPLPIAVARRLPLGSTVTVIGAVSTPPGAFASSFFDDGFGLQDVTAGIYISVPTLLPGVTEGEAARVTGTLQNSAGLLILVPSQLPDGSYPVALLGPAAPITPRPVATGTVGPTNQGLIVAVCGRVTQAAALDTDPTSGYVYGFTFTVNDGSGGVRIFVNTQTGISMPGLTAGTQVTVAGFSSEYDFSTPPPEIDPRGPGDVTLLQGNHRCAAGDDGAQPR